MTEATKRYIPEINAVDGFSPAEFTRELPSDNGTTSLYMDVKFRLLWFRLHRPNGKIEPELVSVDDKSAVVCCKIFNDRSDASDQFVAKSYASASDPMRSSETGSWRSLKPPLLVVRWHRPAMVRNSAERRIC